MKYCKWSIVTFIMLILSWQILLSVIRAPYEIEWIDKLYEKKISYATSLEGPKIVLIGGSATHFGSNSLVLQELTGNPVVSLGTHAGLGISYFLYQAKKILKPHDTAILIFEYPLFHEYYLLGPSLKTYINFYDPLFMLNVNFKNIPTILFNYSPFRVISDQIYKIISDRKSMVVYDYQTLLYSGDESGNTLAKKNLDVKLKYATIYGFGFNMNDIIWREIQNFQEWCSSNNIIVKATWPPMYLHKEHLNEKYTNFYNSIAQRNTQIGIPILGIPQTVMFSQEDMFDDYFHLNIKGNEKYNLILGKLLSQ